MNVAALLAIAVASRNSGDYDRRNASDFSVMGDGVIDGRGGETLVGEPVAWWNLADEARNTDVINSANATNLSMDGADNGLHIKSDQTRGGLVQGVTYEDVCIREHGFPPQYRDTRIPWA